MQAHPIDCSGLNGVDFNGRCLERGGVGTLEKQSKAGGHCTKKKHVAAANIHDKGDVDWQGAQRQQWLSPGLPSLAASRGRKEMGRLRDGPSERGNGRKREREKERENKREKKERGGEREKEREREKEQTRKKGIDNERGGWKGGTESNIERERERERKEKERERERKKKKERGREEKKKRKRGKEREKEETRKKRKKKGERKEEKG
ncbi:RNA-binding protein 25, partial [Ophiophagus hannah]